MNEVAADFLTRYFAPDNPASTQQRIVAFERALSPRCLDSLAQEYATGRNVHVAANPLHSGSRRRTKESAASSEWGREILFGAASEQRHGDDIELFGEVQAFRLLLINTLSRCCAANR